MWKRVSHVVMVVSLMVPTTVVAADEIAATRARDAGDAYTWASLLLCKEHPRTAADVASQLKSLGFVVENKQRLLFEDASGTVQVITLGEQHASIVYFPVRVAPMPPAVMDVLAARASKTAFVGPDNLSFSFNRDLISSGPGKPLCDCSENVEVRVSDGAWLKTSAWLYWK